MKKWALNIENLGRIESAQIEISPMILFVGDNSSGKSYIMSLLWGIFAFNKIIFKTGDYTLDSYKRCHEWMKEHLENREEFSIDSTGQKLFVNWFNDLLQQSKEELIKRIFNYSIEIDNLYISSYYNSNPFIVRIDHERKIIDINNLYKKSYYKSANNDDLEMYSILEIICRALIFDDIFPQFDWRLHEFPLYLPASRTGFMLTYKTLVYNLIDTGFNYFNEEEISHYKSSFTLPVIRFLQYLTKINLKESRFTDIARFIEKNVLQGEIKKDSAPVPGYFYKPANSSKELPPYVTSSLVTELMPLILFLKSDLDYNILIIEEPEAHLHLEVQRNIARALVRLVNRGLAVWLTTHSDTFFQQVNNLIKLHNHSQRDLIAQQFNYIEDDFLKPYLITAYQFKLKREGKTVVERLALNKNGFAVPTFNETIMDLSRETIYLQELDTDED